MLVPVIIILVMAGLIQRTAKKLGVPPMPPLVAGIGIYVIFVLAARGIIPVQMDDAQSVLSGVGLAIVLYVGVAAIVFIGVFIWMKMRSSSRKK